jgi:hypothetical protein
MGQLVFLKVNSIVFNLHVLVTEPRSRTRRVVLRMNRHGEAPRPLILSGERFLSLTLLALPRLNTPIQFISPKP